MEEAGNLHSVAPGDSHEQRLVELAAYIVSTYVGHNALNAPDLAALLRSVHQALQAATGGATLPAVQPPKPAVPVRRSITPEFLISLEDGKPYRTLKRHLTRLGLSPAEYRDKWGLPADYPMVAPNFSARRSALAKANGLGGPRQVPAAARSGGARKPGTRRKSKSG
jgi:predicted transcriptional regulator